MIKISVCMIVKDEGQVLNRALDCVKSFADEIIIVDTGSKDDTKEIAARYTDKIFDFIWCNDFSKARNMSFEKATGDYLMWLDADDVIPYEEQQKILDLKNKISANYSPDIIMCQYVNSVDAQGKPDFYYYRERFIKNHCGYRWYEPVHECITLYGQIERTDIKIYHKKIKPSAPKRNLNIYRNLEKQGVEFSPRALYYYGRELFFNKYYKKSIKILQKFIKSEGWFENKIDACSILSQIYLILNKKDNAKSILFQTFNYAIPRGKTCCEIGKIYQNEQDYNAAIFWYRLALQCTDNESGWIEQKYTRFVPAIELCVCYYRLGNFNEAKYYHELSKSFNPDSFAVKFNEKFFK